MNKNGNRFPRAVLKEVAPAAQTERATDSEEVWHLSLEDVQSDTGRVLKREACRAGELKPSKVWFDQSNVLYSKLRPYLNKVVVPEETGAATSELIPLRPDPSRLDREFLAFYLRGPEFVDFANRITQGANLPRVSMKEFWKHEVPVPPLEEQRRIVACIQECLSRVEEMERLQVEVAEDATHITGRFLYQEFTSIAEASPSVQINDVTRNSRYGTNKKCSEQPDGTPILRIPNVAKGYVNTENLKYCSLDEKEHEKVGLESGDLLVVRTNGSPDLVGRCAVFREDAEFGFASYLIRFRVDQEKVLPEYLSFFLQSPGGRTAIAGVRKTSAGQYNVNSENLRGISFPLPDLATQERLIERARQVQMASSEMAEDHSNDTSALRNAILRQAFAGDL